MALPVLPRPSRVYFFYCHAVQCQNFHLSNLLFFYNLSTKFSRFSETQICVGYKKKQKKTTFTLPLVVLFFFSEY